ASWSAIGRRPTIRAPGPTRTTDWVEVSAVSSPPRASTVEVAAAVAGSWTGAGRRPATRTRTCEGPAAADALDAGAPGADSLDAGAAPWVAEPQAPTRMQAPIARAAARSRRGNRRGRRVMRGPPPYPLLRSQPVRGGPPNRIPTAGSTAPAYPGGSVT